MTTRYEVLTSEKLGRYVVAAKDLKPGEVILSDQPFVLGPNSETGLVCFNCHLPVISKFFVCKLCAVAPICPDDGCPDHLQKWHNKSECEFFRDLKLTKGVNPMTMVQNVGALVVLRALLKRKVDPQGWEEFMQLETHLNERRNTGIWEYHENTEKVGGVTAVASQSHSSEQHVLVCTFIKSLGLLDGVQDELVQKVCAAVDVNGLEVRGPALPALGAAEALRGVYLRAALMAHGCVANTHMSINDNNLLVCHASTHINKGETIYFNYTDPLKGTAVRQEHLLVGKYFKCSCPRCCDVTEMGTYMSSAMCPQCKAGYASPTDHGWSCNTCDKPLDSDIIDYKVQCCAHKLDVINKKDEKELEEYIRNVSLVLAPNHYLLLDAKQRLAGVLRDVINREPRPTNKTMRRKIELCREILPVLEKLSPGICRTKAITLYELHATTVQLARKLFEGRELTGSQFMDELLAAEEYLKRSLEMLFIEPGNSPEGELCAKALEEYRALKAIMGTVLDGLHEEGKTYVSAAEREEPIQSVN